MVLSKFRDTVFNIIVYYVRLLGKIGFKPWHFTLLGFFFSIVYLHEVMCNSIALSILFLLASGFMDVIDGALAKALGVVSKSGAFLDSMIDRLEDVVYYMGFIVLDFNRYIVSFALGLTITLTYSSARLENFGITNPRISLFERSDRITILALILASYMFSAEASKTLFNLYALALTIVVLLRMIIGYFDLK